MLRKKRIQIKNLVTGLIEYLDFKSLQKQLDFIAEYTGGNVKTTPVGEVLSSDVDSAIAELETNKQKAISFYNNDVLVGQGYEFNAGSGAGLSLVGNRVTLTSGATVSAQSFGSNLNLSANPDQYLNLTATNPSLTVTLQQPVGDAVTNIYNAGTNSFSVIGNWEGDPYFTQTELLILGEGTIEDVSFSPKTISLVGDTALSVEQAKFGAESIKFDGFGDYFSVGAIGDWDFLHEGNAWTIDLWVQLTNTTGTLFSTATSDFERGVNILADGTVSVYNGTGGQVLYSGSFTPPALNTWAHIAIVETGADLEIYLDGSLTTTIARTDAPGVGNSNTTLIVGNQVTAYIDAVRITTTARYTTNFTPGTTSPPTFQRIGNYFTIPVLPGIQAAFVFDPAIGWQVPYLLPRFTIQEEGVGLAEIGQIQDLNFTGSALTASFANNVVTVSSTAIDSSEKGAVNGVATLDSSGLIPASQLPVSAMEFKGTWDASTNTPALADGTGNTGDTYRVSVAGSQDLGSGSQTYSIGDWILYNGSIWQQASNAESVASVFGRSGVITAQSGDYTASQVTNVPAGDISSTDIQAAINELDAEKQGDIQIQDDSVNQGTAGSATTVNFTGAGVTASVTGSVATVNIPGAGISPTLTIQEQGSDPTPGVDEATIYIKSDQALRYREESSGAINQLAVLSRHQTYTKAQGVAEVTLTDGANIAVDASLSNAFTVTLAGTPRTLDNPTNLVAGFTYIFRIVSAGNTLSYGTAYRDMTDNPLSTLTGSSYPVDFLTCYSDGTKLYCNYGS